MERHDDLPAGGAGGYGDTGDLSGSQGYAAGTGATTGSTTGPSGSEQGHGVSDRARDIAGSAQEKLADVGSTVRDRAADVGGQVRDKASRAKNSLADALESGADKLRQRAHGTSSTTGTPAYAGATGEGMITTTVSETGRLPQVADKVASGMQSTANWLREADLDELRTGVERQVKEHPGRTLLIALGLGYVIGKAFRK